ncbi:hypothetical protein LY78DRAFT_687023 [Colletotrichum sublineola]|nr:hypothetical protein LY78DRAFT_687023 [Colletotrichum sublineola]
MKLLALVAYGAAVVSCFSIPFIPNAAAATPGSDVSSELHARAPNIGPDARKKLYQQAVKAQKAANAKPLKSGKWYYFMSCGLPENTRAGSKNGITFIKPRPPPKKGRPPLAESEDEVIARKEERIWKTAQEQVKKQTRCDHVGFVVGTVANVGTWFSPQYQFFAQLHYVEPEPTIQTTGKNKGLLVAKWRNKDLTTTKIPGDLQLIYGGTTDSHMYNNARQYGTE